VSWTSRLVSWLYFHQPVGGLVEVGLAHVPGVPGVRPELGEHHGQAELLVNDLEEVAGRDPAVDVASEHVEPLALLGDEVEVLHVAVGDGDQVLRVARLDVADDLAEEGVEEARPPGISLTHRKVLDLGGAPGEAVVVLVAQQPHEEARRSLELVHQGQHLRRDGGAESRVRVVDLVRRDPDAVEGVPVAADGVVDHGVDAVALVDVLHPARRDPGIDADGVHAHGPQERHLPRQGRLDEVVGLLPDAVVVVGADGEVVPVHPEDHEVPAVHPEPEASRGVAHHLRAAAASALRHGGHGGQGDECGREQGNASRRVHASLLITWGTPSSTAFAAITSRYQSALSFKVRSCVA
jgi:hypothetical protein